MIKNIIFDLGNVIINYNQNKIINNFTQKEKEIKYIYDEIFHAPEWTLMDLGDITNDEAIEIINKRNQFKYETLTQDFLHEWYKKQPINRDIVEIAKILKNNGYDLFVLSNMANQTYEYFKNDAYAGNPGCGPDTSNPKNEVFKDQPQDIKAYSSSLWTKVKSH